MSSFLRDFGFEERWKTRLNLDDVDELMIVGTAKLSIGASTHSKSSTELSLQLISTLFYYIYQI